jgi:hypothetical protein
LESLQKLQELVYTGVKKRPQPVGDRSIPSQFFRLALVQSDPHVRQASTEDSPQVNPSFREPQTTLEPRNAPEKLFECGGSSALAGFGESARVFEADSFDPLEAAFDFAAILFQDEEARRECAGVGRREWSVQSGIHTNLPGYGPAG